MKSSVMRCSAVSCFGLLAIIAVVALGLLPCEQALAQWGGPPLAPDGQPMGLGWIPDSPQVLARIPRLYLPVPTPAQRGWRASADVSAGMPPVGSQGAQGSCTAWATGYYYKTYQEGQEHAWDLTHTDHQFSPAFIYNQINGGVDAGSNISDAMTLVQYKGAANMTDMPYSASDYKEWPGGGGARQPSADVWKNAMPYRCDSWAWSPTDTELDLVALKNQLDDGHPFVVGFTVYDDLYTGTILTDDDFYEVPTTTTVIAGHAICIVGYDDDKDRGDDDDTDGDGVFGEYATGEDYDVVGGFKFVNSWGSTWAGDGYGWLSYDFFMTGDVSPAYFMADKIGYTPTAWAEVDITHESRNDLVVTVQRTDGSWSWTAFDQQGADDYMDIHAFLDLTDAIPFLPPSAATEWQVVVQDAEFKYDGEIDKFEIEYPGGTFNESSDTVGTNSVAVGDLATGLARIPGPGSHAPELADPLLDPTEGLQADAYVFEVTYTDLDDDAPTGGRVQLFIENTTAATGWQSFDMAVDTSDPDPNLYDGDYTNGERYTVTVYGVNPGDNEIGDGHHQYYFFASDGTTDVTEPSSGYSDGPTVNDAPAAPANGFDPQSPDYPLTQADADIVVITDSTPRISFDVGSDINGTDTDDTLHYVVQFAQNKTFTPVAVEETGNDGEAFVDVTTPLSEGIWYYRVKTVDDDEEESGWHYTGGDPYNAVTVFKLDLNNPPFWPGTLTADDFTPALNTANPTGEITTDTPTLDWPQGDDSDPSDPVSSLCYRVEVDDNPNFNAPEYESGWLGADVTEADVASALSQGVTYYWRGQIRDDELAESLWTNDPLGLNLTLQFTVLANHRPEPPTEPFTPSEFVAGGETHTAKPTFTWNAGSDPDASDTPDTLHYEVELDEDSDWADGVNLLIGGDEVTADGETFTTMTASAALANEDGQYWWRARTVDDQGLQSDWSETQTFWLNLANNAPDAVVSGFWPDGGVVLEDPPSSLNPTPDPITWDAATDPDHSDDETQLRYIVQLSTDDDFTTVTHELTTAYDVTQVDTPTDLTRGVMWYWRVRAEDDDGAQSAWSHAGGPGDPAPSFYVNQPPVLSLGAAPYDDGLDPNQGGENDTYTFRVTYTDADDDPPTPINLMITNTTAGSGPDAYSLTPVGTAPFDFTAGEDYQVILAGFTIVDGDHTFYFEAEDGTVTTPVQLYFADPDVQFDGPQVNDPPFPPTDNFDPTGGQIVHTAAPTISWDDATDPNSTDGDNELSYRIEFSLTETPFTIEAAYTATTPAGTPSGQPAIALPEGTWFYRVITIDDHGAESAPSVVQEFEVHLNQFPLVPQPVAEYIPADGDVIRSTTPLFEWPEATDPDPLDTAATLHYEIQVDDDIDFSSPVIDGATADGVTQYQTPVADALAFDTQYYWHVRTVDSHDDVSGWTEVELSLAEPIDFTVTINAYLDQPTLAPVYGGLTTWFHFTIVYTDPDDLPPTGPIQVDIGNGHLVVDMTRDPGDTDAWTDGVTFEVLVRGNQLGYGTYAHYFLAPEMSLRWPGAPGTLFGPVVGSGSNLRFTDAAWSNVAGYEEGDTAYVELTDADENENSGAAETVWVNVSEDTSTDSEWVGLTETGNDTGVFRGQIDTLGAAGGVGDGTLNVISGSDGNVITVTYDDPDGGGDSSSDTALVTDTVSPAPVGAGQLIVTLSTDGVAATLNWGAYDEAAQIDVAGYNIYQDTVTFADTTGMTPVATIGAGTQATTITGLTVGEEYFFAVGPYDSVPNEDTNVNDATAGATADVNPPYLENEAPAPGAAGVPFDTDLAFDISDDGSGVDQSTIVVEVNGVDVTADCTIAAKGDAHVGVSYDPTVDFGYNQTVTVHVVAEDDSNNEMDATYQFDTVTDTQAPQVTQKDFSATEGWVSFHLTDDISGVYTPTIAFTIGGTDVTADCTIDDTDPLDVSVLYTATAGWAYNVQLDFAVTCSDVAGNDIDPAEEWSEQSQTDATDPQIDQFNPADGATDVSVATDISCRVRDSNSGVDQSSVTMTVEGEDVTGDLAFKALDDKGVGSLEVTYTPPADLAWETEINVHVEAADDVGNTATADWSFTTEAQPTFTISGETTDADGDALVGVQVTADGQSVLSDGNGVYRITGLLAETYTVTPTKDEYDFTPTSSQQTVGPSQQHVDFVGTLRTYSISGNVSVEGTGLAGVEVTDGTRTATTDANGDYTLAGMPNGTYSVTCNEDLDGDGHSDYRYTPGSQTVNVEGAAVTDVDFTAAATTYTVSGTISDSSGDRIAGVTVTAAEVGAAAAGKQLSAVTNEAGRYTIAGVTASTVELTPAKSGLALDPETLQATVPPNSTDNDFVAYTEFTHSFPAGLNMLGVPCTPPAGREEARRVFGTTSVARWDVAASPPQYVTAEDNPGHPEMQVRPGAGFFVNFAAATDLVIPGDPVPDGGTFSLSLDVGWNMLANMYETALPLRNVNAVAGGEIRPFAFVYDNVTGSYLMVSREPALNAARNYLEAWEGAWFRAVGTGTSVIVTEPGAVASAALVSGADAGAKVAKGGWLVPIVAQAAGRADLTTLAGVGSGDDACGYVVHNPPRAPSSVDVYFTTKSGKRLAHDVRAQSTGSTVWPFVVETDLPQTTVQVSLPDLSSVPNDLAVYLVDVDAERRMYARTLPGYSFTSAEDGAKRHFELVIEPRGTDNLVIKSASVQLAQAGAVVTYEVTKSCQVSIEVLNIAGRGIRHLVTDKAAPAGHGEQVWNLRSDSGTIAPSGAYLVKIAATAENGQRVQALRTLQVTR